MGKTARKQQFGLKRLRSALSHGGTHVPGVDGRSTWMRRLSDLRRLHENDLGGPDYISHSEQVLIARSAMINLQAELVEASLVHSDGVASLSQLDTLQRCLNSVRRTYEVLGIKRRPKEIETLEQYLASKNDAEEKEQECELSENHRGQPEDQQQ